MTALARTPAPEKASWISIREASALIGVSVATLRRWCDAGHVPVFTTPGGHRRFLREAVLDLLPAGLERRQTTGNRSTATRIIAGYRRLIRVPMDLPERLRGMEPTERADLRRYGRQMVNALVATLDTAPFGAAAEDPLARDAASECGRLAAQGGLTLPETLGVFVHFRAPFLHGLGVDCRQRGLDGPAATALLERASELVDRLLPMVVAGYENAANLERQ